MLYVGNTPSNRWRNRSATWPSATVGAWFRRTGTAIALVAGRPGGTARYRYFFRYQGPKGSIVLGPNHDILGSALFLLRAHRLTGRQRDFDVACRQIDWVLGCNPFDASTVEGVGLNQPLRFINGDEFFPPTPQIPGAVMTGIQGDADDNPEPFGNNCSTEYDMPPTAMLMWMLSELSSIATMSHVPDRPAAAAAPTRRAVVATLWVAPHGSDVNPGTEQRPFATIERARDEIRHRKANATLPAAGVTVELRGGTYELPRPLELTALDSGAENAPIVYRARTGETVKLAGSREVTGWKRVTDRAVLERLDVAARGQVWQADLKALGITDLQGINSAATYQSDPGLEVFFHDRPMTLARYPNAGYMHIAAVLDAKGVGKTGEVSSPEGRFICDDPRLARWGHEKGIWLHGFWVWDWADLRIPLGRVDPKAHTLSLGPKPGRSFTMRSGQWFYAENVLPELDSPGEWYLDRDTSILYFWPPEPLSSGKVVVSLVRDLVRLNDVSHVIFRGLSIEAGRGSAFVIRGGAKVRVVACTIRNMGNWGVKVYGGTGHAVAGCDVYQNGQGGIHLEAGDRKTLTPAGHCADNNHIHHTARWDPVYQQAITVFGVGNRATHNLIHDVPHVAIGFTGNDQTIEYNEIHTAVFQSNDAGAIYTSPPDETWSMRGHKIRYNFLHNIHGFQGKGCLGVYLDDCFSSADISGNIFYDVATAVLIGGGRDNRLTNNLFLHCDRAFSIDARGLGWAKGVGDFATKELLSLNYKQPPWSIKYPELLKILEDEPLAPKGNVVACNISWDGKWGSTEPKAAPYVKFEGNLIDVDPRLAGKPPADFGLTADSPALKLGFRPIPFKNIGIYRSEDRASWPAK